MSQSFTSFQTQNESPTAAQSAAAAIYTGPDDVASDPNLTAPQKRAILASWISDARAVENSPALRRLDSGAVVEVDAIRRALRALDAREERERAPLRWVRKVALWNRADDDDDPPPAPAGLAAPFRPTFVAAYGARPQSLAACA